MNNAKKVPEVLKILKKPQKMCTLFLSIIIY